MINKLCIFGVGLIGGSLALALKEANYCTTIVGCSRDENHLKRAVKKGAIDSYTLDPVEAIKDADVILLAVPLRAMSSILLKIKDSVVESTVISDAGSAKGSVIEAVKQAYGGTIPANFVAGHPIAGKEKSSVDAADSKLYKNKKVVLTPTNETAGSSVAVVKKMWEAAGAIVENLGIKQHDDVLAATSHLPHVLAFSLVNTLSKSKYGENVFDYAAGGFKSFSRIASSDPVMWRDICLDNKTAILDSLGAYQSDLEILRKMIEDSDEVAMETLFAHAKHTRDKNIVD